MALQPAHVVLLLRPVGTGRSSGRCSKCPTPRGTNATPTSSDRPERTPHQGDARLTLLADAGHLCPALLPTWREHRGRPRRPAPPPPWPPAGRTIRAPMPSHPGCRPPWSCGAARWMGPDWPGCCGRTRCMTTRVSSGIPRAGSTPRGHAARRFTDTPLGGTLRRYPSVRRWCAAGTETDDEPDERLSAPHPHPRTPPAASARHLALRGQGGTRAGAGRDRVR